MTSEVIEAINAAGVVAMTSDFTRFFILDIRSLPDTCAA